ncbi:hypothetical protein Tco_0463349, partial [Tanacetum coccineum]
MLPFRCVVPDFGGVTDISTTPYVQIYTHLKAYEPHAKKTLKKQEQSTSIVDPLAYVAHTTSAPALSSPSTPSPQPTAQSPNDALMATMTQRFVYSTHLYSNPNTDPNRMPLTKAKG